MKQAILVLFLALVANLVLSGCEKSTGSTSDDPMPGYRTISPQFHSACPSLDAILAQGASDSPSPPRSPWPANTTSYDAGFYDWNGYRMVRASVHIADGSLDPENPPQAFWNARDSEGRIVSEGVYFAFYILLDSAGTVVGRDSACLGVMMAPTDED